MKYKQLIIFSFLLMGLQGYSQNFEQDLNSFTKSINYEVNGEYTKAISSLKKTYKEESYEYNIRLGWLDYLAGQYTESASYYRKAISIMPMSLEARFGLIYPQLALGQSNQVIDIYLDILSISPTDTKANYRLALLYYQQAKYKEADAYLRKVINLYPFDYDTIILMAWNSLNMGKSNEAHILFQKALLLNPTDESATEGLRLIN